MTTPQRRNRDRVITWNEEIALAREAVGYQQKIRSIPGQRGRRLTFDELVEQFEQNGRLSHEEATDAALFIRDGRRD